MTSPEVQLSSNDVHDTSLHENAGVQIQSKEAIKEALLPRMGAAVSDFYPKQRSGVAFPR